MAFNTHALAWLERISGALSRWKVNADGSANVQLTGRNIINYKLDDQVTITGIAYDDPDLGGAFYTDKDDIDITQYIVTGQWNTIALYSSRLGRIDATVFIQAKMGV